jgi:hypothetical protein
MTVRAWVDQHLHFGHRVSSRVEGAHSTLKSYLQVLTGDLKTVYDKISLLLISRFTEFDAAIDHNKLRIPHTARDPLYAPLVGRISSFALGKLWDQRHCLVTSTSLPPCTGLFRNTMGMPCAHEIQQRLSQHLTLQLEDIHSHWFLYPLPPRLMEPLLLDPSPANPRGRPATIVPRSAARPNRVTRARIAASSTQRNLSAFERLSPPRT